MLLWNEYNGKSGDAMNRFNFYLSILVLLLAGCSSDEGHLQIIDERGDTHIIHTEEVGNGVVVFFIPDINEGKYSGVEASFIKKTIFGWKGTHDRGEHSWVDNDELSSQFLYKSDDKSPFPMLYGAINNPNIKEVKIINLYNNNLIQAKIVENEEQRLWYVFLKQPKKETEFEIQGLTDDGEVVTSIINSGTITINSGINDTSKE